MAFYRNSLERQRVVIYKVPRNRAWVPGTKGFLLGNCRDKAVDDDVPLGLVGDDKTSFRPLFGDLLPFAKEGGHYCGTEDQWRYGSQRGVDAPLDWLFFGASTCCEGVLPLGTPNQVAKFGPGGITVIDSRIADTGAGNIVASAAFQALGSFVLNGGPANGNLFDATVAHVAGISIVSFTVDRLDQGVKQLKLILGRADTASSMNLTDPSGATVPGILLNGIASATIGSAGWDVRSGLVFDVPSAGELYADLGLGTVAVLDATDVLLVVNDLADLADVPTARSNLGLGTAAVADDTDFLPAGGTDVKAYLTANQALTQSASNPLTGWTEGTDTLGEFTPATGVFSPTESGTYYVEFRSLLGGAVTRSIALVADTSPATVRRLSDGPEILTGAATRMELVSGTSYTFDVFPTDAGISAQGGAANTWLVIRRAY